MRRRGFIAGLGAAAWPIAAQQPAERMRRIGVLMPFNENDSEMKLSLLCVHTSACGLGLDRRPQRADGPSLGRR